MPSGVPVEIKGGRLLPFMYFLLKEALWQTVRAAMNCRKYNTTFHQGLRTFQRKALHFGNKQNLQGRKNAYHNKTCQFCLLLEHFRNIFANSVAHSDLGQYCLPLYRHQKYQISDHYRPASETPFRWRFACGPIAARFYVLTVHSQANYKFFGH